MPGETLTVNWGDGTIDTYDDTNNGWPKSHYYESAGTWSVRVSDASVLTNVNLGNSLFVNFNSSFFKSCGDNLASVSIAEHLTTPTINSADMAHLKLSGTLSLTLTQAGTYTIDTSHFKDYTVTTYTLVVNTSATTTIARTDWTLYRANIRVEMGLDAAEVDTILLGLYDSLPLKTTNGGTIDLEGQSNLAPTGVFDSNVNCATDPDGGLGAAL